MIDNVITGEWLESLGWWRPNEKKYWVIGIDRKAFFGLRWSQEYASLHLLYNLGSGDLGDENNEARWWMSCTAKSELQDLIRVMKLKP